METQLLFYLVPLASIAALAFAFYFYREMMKESEGTDLMKEIASIYMMHSLLFIRFKLILKVN